MSCLQEPVKPKAHANKTYKQQQTTTKTTKHTMLMYMIYNKQQQQRQQNIHCLCTWYTTNNNKTYTAYVHDIQQTTKHTLLMYMIYNKQQTTKRIQYLVWRPQMFWVTLMNILFNAERCVTDMIRMSAGWCWRSEWIQLMMFQRWKTKVLID